MEEEGKREGEKSKEENVKKILVDHCRNSFPLPSVI